MTDLNLNNNTILLGIVFILGIVIIFCFNNNKKEGFKQKGTNTLEPEILNKLERIITNMSKKVPKSEYDNMSTTLEDLKLFIENKYVLRADVDNKYVLKSEYESLKKSRNFDPSKYVLKSSIPPPIKCPACNCPKVKIEPGLCKKCPPHPPCPQVERCPPITCPAPIPCPETRCPEVKPMIIKDSMICPRPYHKNEPGLKLKDLPKTSTKIFINNRTIQGNVLTKEDIIIIIKAIQEKGLNESAIEKKIRNIVKKKLPPGIDDRYLNAATIRGIKSVNYAIQFAQPQ